MSACEIGSRCGENWVEKKGFEINFNRLYTPPTFENFLVKIMLLIYKTLWYIVP